MKNIVITLLSLWLCFSCDEAELTPYSGKDYVQFTSRSTPTIPYSVNFKWAAVDNAKDYDTLYLPVQSMGQIYDKDRYIMLKQELNLETELVYDELGYVKDTIIYPTPNQAMLGVHYMPLNNPEMKESMKIHANSNRSEIAVVLKRDRVGAKIARKLKVRLIDSEYFLAGDPAATSCTIVIE